MNINKRNPIFAQLIYKQKITSQRNDEINSLYISDSFDGMFWFLKKRKLLRREIMKQMLFKISNFLVWFLKIY